MGLPAEIYGSNTVNVMSTVLSDLLSMLPSWTEIRFVSIVHEISGNKKKTD